MGNELFQDELMVMIPRSISGGKSAYAYAVEGGYLGTEKEFAERLAFLMNGAMVGYVDGTDIVLSGDLTPGTYTFAYVVRKADNTTETVTIGTYTVEEKSPEPTTYTITWIVNGQTSTTTVEEGAMPTFTGSTVKDDDDRYTYAFAGWSPTVVAATADATYTAVYNKTAKEPAVQTYTNLFDPAQAKINTRLSNSNELKTDANAAGKVTTHLITVLAEKLPFTSSTKIYIKGASFTADSNTKVITYITNSTTDYSNPYSGTNGAQLSPVDEGDGVISISGLASSFPESIKRMVLTLRVKDSTITTDDIKNIVITIDEPIT